MTTEQEILLSKINSRQAKVAVIGLGYVGLPLAVEFARAGFFAYGIDIDNSCIQDLHKTIVEVRRQNDQSGDSLGIGGFDREEWGDSLEQARPRRFNPGKMSLRDDHHGNGDVLDPDICIGN